MYICSSHPSPAQFVFFRFVVEVFDQSGNPLWEFSMPVWPGVRTQRLIPLQETKQGKETWPSVNRKPACTRLTSLRTPHSFVCMQIQLSLLSDSPSNPNTSPDAWPKPHQICLKQQRKEEEQQHNVSNIKKGKYKHFVCAIYTLINATCICFYLAV